MVPGINGHGDANLAEVLFRHAVRLALSPLEAARAGNSTAASSAIVAITTNSSVNVKAERAASTRDFLEEIAFM
jgi:hypothetical protein